MRSAVEDWFTVVDRRGRLMWGIGLVLAFVVSIVEIVGAGFVVTALRLVTEAPGGEIELPVIGDVESRLPGSDRVADLRWLAVLALGFFVLRGAIMLGQLYVLYRSSFSLGVRLSDRVTERLLARPYAWHLARNSTELAALAMVITQQFVVSVFTPVQAVGAHALVILALAGVAIAAEPTGTLMAVAVLGVVVLVTLRATKRLLLDLGEREVEETTRGQRLATEALASVREVKIFDLSDALRRDLRRSRQRWAGALRQRATIVAIPRVVIETIALSTLIGFLAIQGKTGPDVLAAAGVLGYAVARLLPTANSLIVSVNNARGAQASMRVLADVLRDTEVDPLSGAAPAPGLLLEAKDLRFSYPDGTEVLRGVDLCFQPGSSIGLVGTTGSGKSTLLDLLIGLLAPTGGQIRLGGEPLDLHRRWWWTQLGVVPQAITLLDATLAENVALGAAGPDIDLEVLHRVLRIAQLETTVEALDGGIWTSIGERGVRLSGGQRQRLAIARALYRDPSVVVLDEGTSALDAETERAVIAALRSDRPDRSLLMVAHRLSTLRDCDEILVMEAGRVVTRGTYDELLARSSTFRRLAGARQPD